MKPTKSDMKKKVKLLKKNDAMVYTLSGSKIHAKKADLKVVELVCGKHAIIAKRRR